MLTYPQERWIVRLGGRVLNVFLRLSGTDFRTYVHPIEQMVAAARRNGLELETRASRTGSSGSRPPSERVS